MSIPHFWYGHMTSGGDGDMPRHEMSVSRPDNGPGDHCLPLGCLRLADPPVAGSVCSKRSAWFAFTNRWHHLDDDGPIQRGERTGSLTIGGRQDVTQLLWSSS